MPRRSWDAFRQRQCKNADSSVFGHMRTNITKPCCIECVIHPLCDPLSAPIKSPTRGFLSFSCYCSRYERRQNTGIGFRFFFCIKLKFTTEFRKTMSQASRISCSVVLTSSPFLPRCLLSLSLLLLLVVKYFNGFRTCVKSTI